MKNYKIKVLKINFLLIIALVLLPCCISCECSNFKEPEHNLIQAFHGKKFVRMDRSSGSDTWWCVDCNYVNPSYANYCRGCSRENDGHSHSHSSSGRTSGIGTTRSSAKDIWNCGHCGFRNIVNILYCGGCSEARQQGNSHTYFPREGNPGREQVAGVTRSGNNGSRETTPRESIRSAEPSVIGLQNSHAMGAQTRAQANRQPNHAVPPVCSEEDIKCIVDSELDDIINDALQHGYVRADVQHEGQPQGEDTCPVCLEEFQAQEKAIKCTTNNCTGRLCTGCYIGIAKGYIDQSHQNILCPCCRGKLPLRTDLIKTDSIRQVVEQKVRVLLRQR